MKELSLNILDITQNSLAANAKNVEIVIDENEKTLRVTIKDDGRGMDEETLKRVSDPFYTTRTTRKVGLGIPFFKLAAEQTGGSLTIQSTTESADPINHGTLICALFYKDSIDFTPVGDIVSTLCTLIQSLGNVNLVYIHTFPGGSISLDTSVLKKTLGEIPLSEPEVIMWINEYLNEQYDNNV
ncbi:MAG: sensor histidine kinase [Eubacteriales bacterium]|nr:sensor histidine kinase [Eubacteriales bacterium]